MNTIEVTIDKSHIVTIGERLYGESVELIRQLINNAYDADATVVKVTINEDSIIVEDDGSGMDLDGLKQYFNIGSTLKKNMPKSPKFLRDRIGEFGIGTVLSEVEVWL
jgi:sensor histidine kinase regulating citrate/malate metabolism